MLNITSCRLEVAGLIFVDETTPTTHNPNLWLDDDLSKSSETALTRQRSFSNSMSSEKQLLNSTYLLSKMAMVITTSTLICAPTLVTFKRSLAPEVILEHFIFTAYPQTSP